METSQKKYTVESLTELIRQDPDKAFELIMSIPKGEAEILLGALPRNEFSEMAARAFVANLAANIEAKVDTP